MGKNVREPKSGTRRNLFVFGTTAELFKILPVLRLVSQDALVLVYTGQQDIPGLRHLVIGYEITELFRVSQDIAKSKIRFLIWAVQTPLRLTRMLRQQESLGKESLTVVVHGDTLTALVGAVTSHARGLKLAHIEAGLRSGSIFHPFPEELVRRQISRLAQVNFAPGPHAAKALEGSPGLVVDSGMNTSIEAIDYVDEVAPDRVKVPNDFVLVSLHRFELFRNVRRVRQAILEIVSLSHQLPVFFVVDSVATVGLTRANVFDLLFSDNIFVLPKMRIEKFHYLLRRCSFLVTDSGGQQEEAFAFGVPCLIYRKHTERLEGLGWNAEVSGWEKGAITNFADRYSSLKKPLFDQPMNPPSKIIAETLERLGEMLND